jgi:hypothetical protein
MTGKLSMPEWTITFGTMINQQQWKEEKSTLPGKLKLMIAASREKT